MGAEEEEVSTTDTTWDPTLTSGDVLNINGTSYVVQTTDSTNWPTQSYKVWPLIRGAQDDPASDEPAGDDTEVDDTDSDDTDDDSSGGEDKGEKTFTQKDLDRILAKEKSKALRGKVDAKDLGFESAKDMKAFVDSMKEKAEADKSDAEKALEDAVNKARDEATVAAMVRAKSITLKAEFRVAAQEAGIPKDRLDDAYALAQNLEGWDDDVSIDDEGVVTGLDEDFFKNLEESKPWLFPSESEGSSGGSGDIGAGAGGKGKLTSDEKLKAEYPALQGFTSN